MTNKLAIIFGLIIIAIFVADHFLLHWGLPVMLGKKLALLTEYIAIWR
ncbi:glyceraldehyde-3-phosphate dehydrogenase [Marinosulfonomonas sp. PRT-SC04]|nr:glyceraldehyde-3-phosphate dehydrogenase [Marinosulfonomonas sp. PRT-SC04]